MSYQSVYLREAKVAFKLKRVNQSEEIIEGVII